MSHGAGSAFADQDQHRSNTSDPQPGVAGPGGPRKSGRPLRGPRVSGDARESVRQPDRPVIELEFGILVYPPEGEGEPWRAVFTENGQLTQVPAGRD